MTDEHKGIAETGPLNGPDGSSEIAWRNLKFNGSGVRYFQIWIVNLVLTLLTLGIYSAWATVRQRRYLYGCTEIAGSRFDFHGNPVRILIGRLIALVLLLAWTQGHLIHVGVQLAALAIVICLFPWFLVNALRFRLRNTSLRNLRFNFQGSASSAYKLLGRYLFYGALLIAAIFLCAYFTFGALEPGEQAAQPTTQAVARFMAVYVLAMVAFTFIYPAFTCDIRNYTANNTAYGNHRFSVSLRKSDFIQYFWGAIALSMAAGAVAVFVLMAGTSLMGLLSLSGEGKTSAASFLGVFILGYLLMGISFTLANAFWQAKTFNLLYSNLRVEQVSFRAELKVLPLCGIMVTNLLLVVFTLGFGYPWAVVRLLRYKLQSISYQGDVDHFAGAAPSTVSAVGDEVGNAFDLDFGFG